MTETATTPAATKADGAEAKQQFVRPEKPDEVAYKDQLYKLEKVHTDAQTKYNAAKAKLDVARPNNKDSPNALRQQELKTELNSIRQTQQGQKSSRTAIMDKVKRLDEQLKSRITELKTAKGKVNFRSVEDIDREVQRLQKDVDTGRMKLVDEKKALNEITSLNKARKNFAGFDAQQKSIDDLKAQIAEQKKLLDDPEQKALSQRYTQLQEELDGLKAEQDGAFKNMKTLIEARDRARDDQQEKFHAIKEHKDTYYQAKRAYADYDFQARKARQERKRQEQLEYQANKRKEVAAKRLEEASAPAYQDEILASEGLIRYFDPSALPAKETTSASKFAASTQRTVDDSGLKGTRLSKKGDDEENYFVGAGGKKNKKGRKGPAAPAETKFSLNLGVLDQLAKVGVNPPSSQADVPATVEKLKEKLAKWKSEQDAKTKENIAKAQKEIDRLEAEDVDSGATDVARKPAEKNQAVNGGPISAAAELEQERDAEADVAEDLAKAAIEDKEAPES
ncbi:multicopy suppressor of BFA (Brefeldin A) [Kalmusia sp. IMI 367209]|nr:multicopy suppressor of BFA (Brefeldin A) [Kalmusia sp. IMI 367209]